PFTGDFAGDLLYETLLDYGFARGEYRAVPDDGLTLTDCSITNAVRCVPPENKPVGAEIKSCRPFLLSTIDRMDGLCAYLALGRIAHDTLLTALGLRRASYPFSHRACHNPGSGPVIFDSYHCSRYNTNTGRLTRDMFRSVFDDIRAYVDQSAD
ncbi:MAG: uracil-DNA glycosylase family protein, partial [Stappiaceae bacterium]